MFINLLCCFFTGAGGWTTAEGTCSVSESINILTNIWRDTLNSVKLPHCMQVSGHYSER